MEIDISKLILAIITEDSQLVSGGGAPVFIASTTEEKEQMALNLSRILGGMIHDLGNGVFFIVKH